MVVQEVVIGEVLTEYVEAIRSRPLVVVVLAPDPAVVAAREASREKVAYRQGPDGIADLDAALRAETPRIGLWLDTSDHEPDRTVDEIIRRGLTEGRVS